MKLSDEGYYNLVYAMADRARIDYYNYKWKILLPVKRTKKTRRSNAELINEAKRLFNDARLFILSDWYAALTGIDGRIVLEDYEKDFQYWSIEYYICEGWK